MSKLGDLLKEKNMTQSTVAEKLGVHQTLISQWCRGKGTPNIRATMKLARILGVDYTIVIEALLPKEEISLGERPTRRQSPSNKVKEKEKSNGSDPEKAG